MTTAEPLWVQNLAYNAQAMRGIVDGVWPNSSGVIDGLTVGPGSGLAVSVGPGLAVVAGSDMPAQGSYLCKVRAPVALELDGTPGPGLSRIDLVVARVTDDAVTGTGTPGLTLEALTGDPAPANPQPPAVPATAEALAQVTVASGTASITPANITERRRWLSRLGPRPVWGFLPVQRAVGPGQVLTLATVPVPSPIPFDGRLIVRVFGNYGFSTAGGTMDFHVADGAGSILVPAPQTTMSHALAARHVGMSAFGQKAFLAGQIPNVHIDGYAAGSNCWFNLGVEWELRP